MAIIKLSSLVMAKLIAAPNTPYKGTNKMFKRETKKVPATSKSSTKKDFFDLYTPSKAKFVKRSNTHPNRKKGRRLPAI